MFLEKMQKHSGKILFFLTGSLLLTIGIVAKEKRKIERENSDLISAKQKALELQYAANVNKVQSIQNSIVDDQQQKKESLADNPEVVIKEETVSVTRVVPGATRKITVSES